LPGGDAITYNLPATAGSGVAGAGADGGIGSVGNTAGSSPVDAAGGGGGGGGGGGPGIIHAFGGTFPAAQASPPPS
jgi:hypothetical protein